MVGIDFMWTVGFFFSNLLQCYPIKVNWTALGNLNGYCVDTNMLLIAQSWSDITTDGTFPATANSIQHVLIGTQL